MNKMMMKSFAALMMLGAFAIVSFAQDRETVKFPKGKTSVTMQKNIGEIPDIRTLEIKAQKGQKLTFKVDSKATDYKITFSRDGEHDFEFEAKTGESKEYKVLKNGTYYITLANYESKSVPFRITVSLK
jgi:hypothetical protein